jgi:hypothetical protein
MSTGDSFLGDNETVAWSWSFPSIWSRGKDYVELHLLSTLRLHFVINVKVKLSLCLTKHHTMKMYWVSGGIAARILVLCTRWSWVVRFKRRPLYLQERARSTHWIGGWVSPRAVLVAVVIGNETLEILYWVNLFVASVSSCIMNFIV